MSVFKKILVATDLSQPADEAIRQADQWAHSCGAQLFVCHVLPTMLHSNPLFPQDNLLEAVALPEFLDQVADAVTERVQSLTGRSEESFQVLVDQGSADDCVVQQAEVVQADLIVVGSRGHTGLKHIFLGSVADRVVRYAKCAVLVARPSPTSAKVLATTDFSDPAQPAVARAVQEAKRRNARLTIMHSLGAVIPPAMATAGIPFGAGPFSPPSQAVEEARQAASELLTKCLERFEAQGDCVVATGSAEEEILRVAQSLPAELIVVGSQGRTGLARVALGSVAETVARRAHCSVLVVRFENPPYGGTDRSHLS